MHTCYQYTDTNAEEQHWEHFRTCYHTLKMQTFKSIKCSKNISTVRPLEISMVFPPLWKNCRSFLLPGDHTRNLSLLGYPVSAIYLNLFLLNKLTILHLIKYIISNSLIFKFPPSECKAKVIDRCRQAVHTAAVRGSQTPRQLPSAERIFQDSLESLGTLCSLLVMKAGFQAQGLSCCLSLIPPNSWQAL